MTICGITPIKNPVSNSGMVCDFVSNLEEATHPFIKKKTPISNK